MFIDFQIEIHPKIFFIDFHYILALTCAYHAQSVVDQMVSRSCSDVDCQWFVTVG